MLSMENDQAVVPMGSIASSLGVTPGTATSMMKNLQREKWLTYKSRKGVTLTVSGKKLGMRMIRRHRLLETFLVETLGLDWSEIHDEAEELEHAISEKVLERLDVFLGNPQHDPHGEPIPNKAGLFPKSFSMRLNELESGASGQVVGVSQDNPSFLQYLDSLGIKLGTSISVVQKIVFDGSLEITINNKSAHISKDVAKNLLIKQK